MFTLICETYPWLRQSHWMLKKLNSGKSELAFLHSQGAHTVVYVTVFFKSGVGIVAWKLTSLNSDSATRSAYLSPYSKPRLHGRSQRQNNKGTAKKRGKSLLFRTLSPFFWKSTRRCFPFFFWNHSAVQNHCTNEQKVTLNASGNLAITG